MTSATAPSPARRMSCTKARPLWLAALLVSLVGALHWVAAAFGIDGLTALFGQDPMPLRLVHLGIAAAAVYAIIGILRASRP